MASAFWIQTRCCPGRNLRCKKRHLLKSAQSYESIANVSTHRLIGTKSIAIIQNNGPSRHPYIHFNRFFLSPDILIARLSALFLKHLDSSSLSCISIVIDPLKTLLIFAF